MPLIRSNPRLGAGALLLLSALPSVAYDFSAVDRLLEDSLSAFGDSVAVVIRKDGKIIYHNSKGGLDTSDKIGIASASKWVTGAVILRLAEKNLLRLDDTLGSRLPAFSAHGKGHLTIRQCFSMTSGLFGGKNYEINPLMTLERSVDSIAAHTPLAFAPGSRFAYTGASMQSVARLAEIVTGKPWSQVAREELLEPCGMVNTTYDHLGPLNPAVAGGIRTSASEYMRFLGMVMDGGRSGGKQVLSAASLAEMFKDQTGGASVLYSPWPGSPETYADGKPPGYGFGCWAMSTNPATGQEDEIGSPGAFGAFPWADRCRNLHGLVMAHNAGEGERAHAVTLRIIALVREQVGGCVSTAAGPGPIRAATGEGRPSRSRFEGSVHQPFFGAAANGGAWRRADGRLLPALR